MAKKDSYICQSCSNEFINWVGKCPRCSEWNTLIVSKRNLGKSHTSVSEELPQRIKISRNDLEKRIISGIQEFDNVLGGGIVKGSTILISGEPGVGKSTLLSSVLGEVVKQDMCGIYISGEESVEQIAQRMTRLQIIDTNIYIYHETILQKIMDQLEKLKPKFLVLDSIQTTISNEITSYAASSSQVREVTYELSNYLKKNGITAIIIGHITKDGTLGGPKLLEHMVDVVLYLENPKDSDLRFLRATKNRYGKSNEVGVLEISNYGFKSINNPSAHFIGSYDCTNYGSALAAIIEGNRTLLVEVQALVFENKYLAPKISTQGIESGRVAMIIAVAEKYLGIKLCGYDIYLNIVGGIKIKNYECDLAILAAIISSFEKRSINPATIFLGEIGLTGEVRSITNLAKRVNDITSTLDANILTATNKNIDLKNKKKLIQIKNIKELQIYIMRNIAC